eukprot:scaffold311268_cov56-Attheya_sp.AAC.5
MQSGSSAFGVQPDCPLRTLFLSMVSFNNQSIASRVLCMRVVLESTCCSAGSKKEFRLITV